MRFCCCCFALTFPLVASLSPMRASTTAQCCSLCSFSIDFQYICNVLWYILKACFIACIQRVVLWCACFNCSCHSTADIRPLHSPYCLLTKKGIPITACAIISLFGQCSMHTQTLFYSCKQSHQHYDLTLSTHNNADDEAF